MKTQNKADSSQKTPQIALTMYCESCGRNVEITFALDKNLNFDLTSGCKWDTDCAPCPYCNEWLHFEIAFTQIQNQL